MRRVCAGLILILLTNLIAACASSGTWRPDPPPRPTDPIIGRWEIIPLTAVKFEPNENGWTTVRIPLAIENRTNRFGHAQIPARGSVLYTNQSVITDSVPVSYTADLWETKGFTNVPATEINYNGAGPIPPRLRICGVYINDAVSSYFFQARIPKAATPASLVIPGYSDHISLIQKPAQAPPPVSDASTMNRPVSIPGKAILAVNTITLTRQAETSFNHVAHDRIKVTFTMTNTNPAYDSEIELRATAIGEREILGSPIQDEVLGCGGPRFTVGPAMRVTRSICAILPFGSHKVRVMLTGDVNEIYVPGF